MKQMSREDFDYLVHCARHYDPSLAWHMYDHEADAEVLAERNAAYEGDFDEVLAGYGLNGWIREFCGCGAETADKLEKWLAKMGVDVESKEPDQKHVWTEEEIKELIQTNDKVLYGALRRLYAEQTADEQSAGETKHYNGVGFNGADARILSSFVEFLNRTGFLTPKQKAVARKKLVKYTKQLTRLANAD